MIHFEIPKNQSSIIKVIGVGGGGCNAVNYMHSLGIEGVDFIVCNTDSQSLALSPIANKVQLGPHLTQGLGAGANPEIGKQACEESYDDIEKLLKVNTKMVFVTAGMGGGTGTGGAPVVAKICRDLGILTVGIVTTPFTYEGKKRLKQAEEGIERMREHVDTLLILSNDKLRQQFGNLPFTQAFSKADDVLAISAKCITDVINTTGQINTDFADVSTVMRNGGRAILGSAQIAGENRAQLAVEQALNSPLLNDDNIHGAKWILLNILSSPGEFEHTMDENDIIQAYVQAQAGDDCEVILGMGQDASLGDKISVTVIATGFKHKGEIDEMKNEANKIVVSLEDTSAAVHTEEQAPKAIVVEASVTNSMMPTLVAPTSPTENFETPTASYVAEPAVFVAPAAPEAPAEPTSFSAPPQAVVELVSASVASLQATTSNSVETPIASVQSNMPSNLHIAKTVQPSYEEEITLVVAETPMVSANAQPEPARNFLLEHEMEEKRLFEQQQRAFEERVERLRNMSNGFNKNNNVDDIENVPAYMRKNMTMDHGVATNESYLSGYSVAPNNSNGPLNPSPIQTINTFLEGDRPD
jgi:cell division protein FtsZ